jgi:hypothetical protein
MNNDEFQHRMTGQNMQVSYHLNACFMCKLVTKLSNERVVDQVKRILLPIIIKHYLTREMLHFSIIPHEQIL